MSAATVPVRTNLLHGFTGTLSYLPNSHPYLEIAGNEYSVKFTLLRGPSPFSAWVWSPTVEFKLLTVQLVFGAVPAGVYADYMEEQVEVEFDDDREKWLRVVAFLREWQTVRDKEQHQ